MTDRLSDAIKNVRDILQKDEHPHCVAVTLFFNCEGYEMNRTLRSPSSLKREGISMRNLKGEFIK